MIKSSCIHHVEDEWFYPILSPLGFTSTAETASGFVRSYTCTHKDGRWVKCSIGVNSNNWSASDGAWGFESSLKIWAIEHYINKSTGCFSHKQL